VSVSECEWLRRCAQVGSFAAKSDSEFPVSRLYSFPSAFPSFSLPHLCICEGRKTIFARYENDGTLIKMKGFSYVSVHTHESPTFPTFFSVLPVKPTLPTSRRPSSYYIVLRLVRVPIALAELYFTLNVTR